MAKIKDLQTIDTPQSGVLLTCTSVLLVRQRILRVPCGVGTGELSTSGICSFFAIEQHGSIQSELEVGAEKK